MHGRFLTPFVARHHLLHQRLHCTLIVDIIMTYIRTVLHYYYVLYAPNIMINLTLIIWHVTGGTQYVSLFVSDHFESFPSLTILIILLFADRVIKFK